MAIQHTSRTGKTYSLLAGVTKTGKPKYFFSTKPTGNRVDAIPDGFEIYENVDGQVFLRKIPKQIITPAELSLVEAALQRHGEAWEYRAEAKKDIITVYECGTDIAGLNEVARMFARRPLSDAEKVARARYMAVLRFVLADATTREFVVERFCFRGSVDDWIYVDGPAHLSNQIQKYIKHLGKDSIYELI